MDVLVSKRLSPDLLASLQSPAAMNADGSFATTWKPEPYQRLITTHDFSKTTSEDGEPRVSYLPESGPGPWQQVSPSTFFSLIYTANSTPQLNGDADVKAHDALLDSQQLGLTNSAGAVFRMVELAPVDPNGVPHFMHRTESLDLGVVLKGEVELHVPGSEPRILRQGDVVMQRGTMHSWANRSTTEPSRMLFCLLRSEEPVKTPDGKELKDALPEAPPGTGINVGDMLKAKRT